jgi:antitoxin component YwqK of YwqJK toxin-antitoxin module
MKAISTNKKHPFFNGPRVDFYENGKWKKESNYVNNQLIGQQNEWYENGEKKSEKLIQMDSVTKKIVEVNFQFWNKEGQQTVIDGNGIYEFEDEEITEKGEIKNGIRQGTWTGKNRKQNFSYSEIYDNGKLISGISEDADNNKYPYSALTEKAIPKAGMNDFMNFIKDNYRIPYDQKLNGKIFVKFIVEVD